MRGCFDTANTTGAEEWEPMHDESDQERPFDGYGEDAAAERDASCHHCGEHLAGALIERAVLPIPAEDRERGCLCCRRTFCGERCEAAFHAAVDEALEDWPFLDEDLADDALTARPREVTR